MEPDFLFLDKQFQLPGPVATVVPYGSGHIHDTYLLTCLNDQASRFILQRFNHFVFKNPNEVMANISQVLDHLGDSNDQSELVPFKIVKTKSGGILYKSPGNEYWRIFSFVENSESYDQVTNPELAQGGGKAFGHFIEGLKTLDPKKLFTTIPEFHNVSRRFEQLKSAIDADSVGRVSQYQKEVEFSMNRETKVFDYSTLASQSDMPYRVTHNDTKINNVLFRSGTTQGICVLDLDTVMPGLLLYDFGDMGRTFCNNVLEEGPMNDAWFRLDLFKSLCQGFFGTFTERPGKTEVEGLKIGTWWMTYIMGIRFLADFLSGDIYYKISHPMQNLDRARNQFHLLADIEAKQQKINQIIEDSLN